MAVDIVDPDIITRKLQTRIVAGNYRGSELLKRVLIKEGICAIICGMHPAWISNNILAPYFGEDFLPEYMEAISYAEIEKSLGEYIPDVNGISEFFGKIKNEQLLEKTNLLEELVLKLDDEAISVLHRATGQDYTMAILGSSEDVIKRLLNSMSKGNAEKIMQDCCYSMSKRSSVRDTDVEAAQKKLLAKIKELEEQASIRLV